MTQKKPSGKTLVIQLDRDTLRINLTSMGAEAGLRQHAALPVPEGAVEDGILREPETLQTLLRSALEQPEFRRTRRVVFSICSTQIIAGSAMVPAVKTNKLEKLLKSNMDLYFPVDPQEYRLVFKAVGPAADSEKGQEIAVQLWAVPNALLAGYYALANDCGLTVVGIDYCGVSAATAVGASFAVPTAARTPRLEGKKRKTGGRHQRSEAPESQAADDVPALPGTDTPDTTLYLLAEREYLIMTFVQAGQVKLQRLLLCGSDPEGTLSEAMMVQDYFFNMDAGRQSRVSCVLCGSLAENEAFKEAVQEALDLPVRSLGQNQDSAWCICLGAARMTLDFGDPTMNRKSGARLQLAQAWQYGLVLVGGALLTASLLLMLGSWTSHRFATSEMENTIRSLEVQKAQGEGKRQYYDAYSSYKQAYDAYSADWDTLLGTEDTSGALRTYNDNLVLALEELETVMPSAARVVTIGIADQGLGIQLACDSKEDAAYTLITLRKLQYADLKYISDLSYGSGVSGLSVLSALTGTSTEELQAAMGQNADDAAAGGSEDEANADSIENAASADSGEDTTETAPVKGGDSISLSEGISGYEIDGATLKTLLPLLEKQGMDAETIQKLEGLAELMEKTGMTFTPEQLIGNAGISSGTSGGNGSSGSSGNSGSSGSTSGDTVSEDERIAELGLRLQYLNGDQLDALQNTYGPEYTDYDLNSQLSSATMTQRKQALRSLLETDQAAMYKFFLLMRKDVERDSGNQVLAGLIWDEIWADPDIHRMFYESDQQMLDKYLPELLDALTANKETLSATEKLIQEDQVLSAKLSVHLAWAMGDLSKADTALDLALIRKEMDSGEYKNREADTVAAVEVLVEMDPVEPDVINPDPAEDPNISDIDWEQVVSEIIKNQGGNSGNSGSADDPNSSGINWRQIIDEALNNQSGDNSNSGSLNLGTYVDSDWSDEEWAEFIDSWLGNQESGADNNDGSANEAGAGTGNGTGVGGGSAAGTGDSAGGESDGKYYITVALQYKEDLIRSELERKGLYAGGKAAELEVGE